MITLTATIHAGRTHAGFLALLSGSATGQYASDTAMIESIFSQNQREYQRLCRWQGCDFAHQVEQASRGVPAA